MSSLSGKVCLVTGATRGIGRGIALQLGEAGATVYITGRTLKKKGEGVGGSLEETAEEIEARGGRCIPVQCDHSQDDQVTQLFDRITREQNGRLDVLVNNAYSAVSHISRSIGIPFWEQEPGVWDEVNHVGLRNHYLCTVLAARIMVSYHSGLIINVSSPGGLRYLFNVPYGIGKAACDRMATDCGLELRKQKVAMVSLWPGAVQTEMMMDAINKDDVKVKGVPGTPMAKIVNKQVMKSMFIDNGETVEFAGRCVVHLAQDPNILQKTGRILLAADLAEEYGFTDVTGKLPESIRSVGSGLRQLGWKRLGACVPRWCKLPYWMITLAGSKF